jgi:hypothetical protein
VGPAIRAEDGRVGVGQAEDHLPAPRAVAFQVAVGRLAVAARPGVGRGGQ